jgi:hypothetical protein
MALSSYLLKLVVLTYFGAANGLYTNPRAVNIALSAAASSGWTSLGCYTDSVAARSLPYGAGIAGGPTAMTVELCQSACLAAGYKLAGVEYADECCKCFSL